MHIDVLYLADSCVPKRRQYRSKEDESKKSLLSDGP